MPSRSRMLAQQVEDPGLDRHVERGRRLVGDQHLRVARERHRDHHALPHAAGELVRVLVERAARARGCARGRAARPPARARRAASRPRCSRSTSPICRPTVNTGFSDVIGSWKTNEISRPRTLAQLATRRARAGRARRSARPPITAAVGGSRRSSDSAVTLLPQPDSPTMPSTSPRLERRTTAGRRRARPRRRSRSAPTGPSTSSSGSRQRVGLADRGRRAGRRRAG